MTFAQRVIKAHETFDPDNLEDWAEAWIFSGALSDKDSWPDEEELSDDEWYSFPMEGDEE